MVLLHEYASLFLDPYNLIFFFKSRAVFTVTGCTPAFDRLISINITARLHSVTTVPVYVGSNFHAWRQQSGRVSRTARNAFKRTSSLFSVTGTPKSTLRSSGQSFWYLKENKTQILICTSKLKALSCLVLPCLHLMHPLSSTRFAISITCRVLVFSF